MTSVTGQLQMFDCKHSTRARIRLAYKAWKDADRAAGGMASVQSGGGGGWWNYYIVPVWACWGGEPADTVEISGSNGTWMFIHNYPSVCGFIDAWAWEWAEPDEEHMNATGTSAVAASAVPPTMFTLSDPDIPLLPDEVEVDTGRTDPPSDSACAHPGGLSANAQAWCRGVRPDSIANGVARLQAALDRMRAKGGECALGATVISKEWHSGNLRFFYRYPSENFVGGSAWRGGDTSWTAIDDRYLKQFYDGAHSWNGIDLQQILAHEADHLRGIGGTSSDGMHMDEQGVTTPNSEACSDVN